MSHSTQAAAALQPEKKKDQANDKSMVFSSTGMLEGPSTKKFKVLASLMASGLDKQFSKHLVGPINEN